MKNAVPDKVSDICKSLISAKLFLKVEKKVKVLLVGAAFSADLHMDGYARCTDIAEIVAEVLIVPPVKKIISKKILAAKELAGIS